MGFTHTIVRCICATERFPPIQVNTTLLHRPLRTHNEASSFFQCTARGDIKFCTRRIYLFISRRQHIRPKAGRDVEKNGAHGTPDEQKCVFRGRSHSIINALHQDYNKGVYHHHYELAISLGEGGAAVRLFFY